MGLVVHQNMWNLPAPGIEPVLPAGEVLSTKPPGKSAFFLVLKYILKIIFLFYWGITDKIVYIQGVQCDQFSYSVESDFLWPHGLQHARLPSLSPTPGVCPNSCPSSQWCHPTISFSVVPFSSCLQSFPASGSFLMSRFFASGGQSIGVSASASVLPMNIQDWFPLG